jgi:Flp pilus assembly protein TadD
VDRVIGVLGRHDQGSRAEAVAGGWMQSHPADPQAFMMGARAAVAANRTPLAIERAQRAVALAPDSLAPIALLARVYQGAKRWSEAESVWAAAAVRFPSESGVALDLAFCREQRGDLAGAEQAARDVLAREGENPTALNFLGYLLADHNRNLEEAERLIRRAVAQEPENGAFVDSMGWVYFRLGRLEEARAQLERAVTLTGGDPVVHEHLGDVYKELHFMDLAQEQYRLSLAGDASNKRVRTKLSQAR